MSVIMDIKGLILSNFKGEPKIKSALLNVLNELDNDLNVGGYEPSSDVDKSIDELDKALIDLDEIESIVENEEEEEEDVGYKEKEISDDENDNEE
jgi:hypothetical protein